MKYILKELSLDMGKDEYEMFQEIPKNESGQTNNCFGIPYSEFKDYLKKEIDRKHNDITLDDTPVTSYIMYIDNKPVGIISLRTKIDENWKKWSGNFYYKIRTSERGKGYCTKMLYLALDKFRKLGIKEIYGNASKGNVASSGVIEANGGKLLEEINGSKYYKITLNDKLPSIKLDNFLLESFDETNPFHADLKNNIINMEDSYLISENIDNYIKRNFELGKIDNITKTCAIIYDNSHIGLAFINYHPKETISNIDYDEEIEIGIGILPEFRGKGLGNHVEKELSEKLLIMYPNFNFIVARTEKDNIASIKMGKKAGFNHVKDDEYHYLRK